MNPLIQLKKATPIFVVAFALACFGLSPTAQAVSPPPDGAYGGANTAEGNQALFSLTTGSNNTALGSAALFSVTSGIQNTATGAQALNVNTADFNTADGFQALVKNTTGSGNTATGWRALFQNTAGNADTAIGSQALYRNQTDFNTAVGTQALLNTTTGDNNTALGAATLITNTIGHDNTGLGVNALFSNVDGNFNTAVGKAAMGNNTHGIDNTAVGFGALINNTIGDENIAVGDNALESNTTGDGNIALGSSAGTNLTTGSNNIDIGHGGVANEGDTIRIGVEGTQTATFIAGISGETTGLTGVPVLVDANGQLGTISSSRRFKNEIKPMDKTSEAILALKPVTFHYKSDTRGTPQFGLIAEEVAAVNPDLVVRDKNGDIYTVRYDAVNAMLLNEFLKEHRKVEQLTKDFEAKFAEQQKQIKALTAGLQKVSAQLEVSKSAPQTAVNSQ